MGSVGPAGSAGARGPLGPRGPAGRSSFRVRCALRKKGRIVCTVRSTRNPVRGAVRLRLVHDGTLLASGRGRVGHWLRLHGSGRGAAGQITALVTVGGRTTALAIRPLG